MEYLNPRDLGLMSRVSRTIKKLYTEINCSASRFDDLLLHSRVFKEYFARKPREEFKIGYFLQNKYYVNQLRLYSFKEMGEKGILKKYDKEVYDICSHHKIECKLMAFCHNSHGGEQCKEDPYYDDDPQLFVDWSEWIEPPWDVEHGWGVAHAKVMEDVCVFSDMCPVICIPCPGHEWREQFLSRVKGVRFG